MSATAAADPPLHATAALRRAATLVTVMLAAALATGRPEPVVLAAPIAAGTLLALTAAGAPGGLVLRAAARGTGLLSEGRRALVHVDVTAWAGAQLAVVRLPDEHRVPHALWTAVALDEDGARTLRATVRPRRWGRVVVARPDVLAAGPDGLLVHDPVVGQERVVTVVPVAPAVSLLPLPSRPAGLVGTHRTRRPGDGSDLLDVRALRPGDPMRRIDWRVSARRGELHVRRTAVDADADVVLCLDTRLDVGEDVARWPGPPGPGPEGATRPGSSLDRAVHTAAALAEAHLREGDRVALLDLTQPRRSVPPGTGRRQLRRVTARLATAAVQPAARRLLLRPRAIPVGAVAVLLSPLLDAAAADLAASLRRRGGLVVVVDVLPSPLRAPSRAHDPRAAAALRLVLAERDVRLAALRRAGVVVVDADPATLAARLRRLHAAARRGVA